VGAAGAAPRRKRRYFFSSQNAGTSQSKPKSVRNDRLTQIRYAPLTMD
jgi:hypothetical protein